ncbi:MAG: endonuclease/exonuclease/phosphatase family protein [Candidatus Caenarcaniphilales bacterium]|nr:endonuclease/exonuclease/phosphatase family protein [Candidatus Caenarcaniphilales bacterium]
MFCFLYCLSVIGLLIAGHFLGDSIWWLAVVNSFRFWLFAPALLFWFDFFVSTKEEKRDIRLLGIVSLLWIWLYGWYPFYEQVDPKATRITILTHNIYYRNDRLEGFAKVIHQYKPDIIALQEVTDSQYNKMKDLFEENYPYRSVRSSLNLVDVMVMSKFPLSEIKSIPTSSGHATYMKAKTGSGEIHLVNLHTRSIEPFDLLDRRWQVLNTYAQYPKTVKSVLDFLAKREAGDKAVIVGDFNSTEGNQPYKLLSEHGFQDAYRHCNPQLPYWGFSFPKNLHGSLGRNFMSFPFLRLDYIWVGGAFGVSGSEIVQDYTGSDHAPMLATLVISNN